VMKNRETIFTTMLSTMACFALGPGRQAVRPPQMAAMRFQHGPRGSTPLASRPELQNTGCGLVFARRNTDGSYIPLSVQRRSFQHRDKNYAERVDKTAGRGGA